MAASTLQTLITLSTRSKRSAEAQRLRQALSAHVAWIDANALGYRAILQGGISADPAVQAIVEDARAEVVRRIAGSVGVDPTSPAQRLALRGWVGFL